MTIAVSADLDIRFRYEARRRGITMSALAREAIETHLGERRRLGAAGAGSSGRDWVSERIEEILAMEGSFWPSRVVPLHSGREDRLP